MVSSFANYVFFVPAKLRRSAVLRKLRCHWLIEPVILCVVLILLVSGARAADLDDFEAPGFDPVPAPTSIWAGPYLGFEAGPSQTVTEVKANGRTKDASRLDAAFGLFGGYNWQVSRFVLGVEGGATYLGGRETVRHPALGSVKTGAKWTASAKARAGLPIRNFMPYVSVGLAATEHSLEANGKERSSVSLGPVLGAGLEVAVQDKWRLRADYSVTGIVDDKANYGGTSVKRASGNHRFMIGLSRSF
ncbi:OmpA-like transmembrane domain protein [Labrenzia sp. THAF82]|uniref:outer membrane protein n=1 Tax=Labrenzia sp. THAF82 TaxID=2587861 RepID=UPI001268C29B|nr:outer membrane beta-barrel protein [Labrenzia sp. THAF82]QFT31529.1 OmpA-like transmembrane domain protein [Labrenzia sp. THAF82]